MTYNKKTLAVLSICLLALLVSIFYLYKKVDNGNFQIINRYDWLPYTSAADGYIIDYPKGADILAKNPHSVEFKLDHGIFGVSLKELRQSHGPNGGGFSPMESALSLSLRINSQDVETSLSVKDWVDQNLLSKRQAPSPSLKEMVTLADGIPAYYVEYKNGSPFEVGNYTAVRYYFIKGKRLFTIEGIKTPEACDVCKKDPYFQYVKSYELFFKKMVDSLNFPSSA